MTASRVFDFFYFNLMSAHVVRRELKQVVIKVEYDMMDRWNKDGAMRWIEISVKILILGNRGYDVVSTQDSES